MVRKLFVLFFLIIHFKILAQNGSIRGFIYEESSGEPAMFSNILIKKIEVGAVTDVNGFFNLSKIPVGDYKIIVTYIGYEPIEDSIKIDSILCERPPATDWSTGLECLITSLASPID